MSESAAAWMRLVIFVVIVIVVGTVAGLFAFQHFARTDPSGTDGQSLAQIQEQLTSIQKRLADLETRSKAQSARTPLNAKTQEEVASNQSAAPRPPRPQYQVSPVYALPAQPAAARPSGPDPVSAQKIASLQQGIGTLQQETESNRQAWQATADRLADVAGELGAQHGQILQNQDELHEFLGRAEHTSVTFELRRSSTAESVGPVRISLKAANQKSKKYTLCVYVQDSCVEVKDRVLYEVVQLAVSHDASPIELIATEVGKDEIVGYVEVPKATPGN